MNASVGREGVLAYWLLPAAAAREFFQTTIGRLAAGCDAPVFEPHLTLGIGPDLLDDAQRRLRGVAAGPIELRAGGIDFTAKFTQTLFVRFDSNPSLENLRDSLGLAGGGAFDPHVSLLYKKMPADKQAQLAAVVRLPFQTVWFDALQVVRCRLPVATPADVASWEVVVSHRLKA
jgi:hypothetical protein